MTELEQLWRRKTDYDVLVASRRLHEYSHEAQQAIRSEVLRRRSPEYLSELESIESVAKTHKIERPQRQLEEAPAPASSATWFAQRVALAVSLMIGFYLFAIAIAFALLWIPYAEYVYGSRIDFQIAFFCIGSGVTILWALLPRPDRFVPPGPRLDAERCPRLFSIVTRIAEATAQTPPSDIYLLNDVNAFVAQRGGIMGFRSRRVMGIGLPLLQAVTVPEFEAIIAHEFGHYSSSDLALGPWIYKTRAAIVRTITSIRRKSLRTLFVWYGRRFLTLTYAVSRRQEFIADQISARIAGARAIASALKRLAVAGPMYRHYLRQEVAPVLNAGHLPPLSAGFDQFLASDHIGAASRSMLTSLQTSPQVSPFDTHPSLSERLTALGITDDNQLDSNESASALIDKHEHYARLLLEFSAGADRVRALKSIEWTAAAPLVYPPQWRVLVKQYAPFLRRYTADALPSGKNAFARAGTDLVAENEFEVPIDQRIGRAVYLFTAAIGIMLLDEGWHMHSAPGHPITFVRASDTLDPFARIRALANEQITLDTWRAECHARGIAGRPLAEAAAPVAGATTLPPLT